MDPGEYIQPGQYKESSLGKGKDKDKDKDNTSNNCFAFKQKIMAVIAVAVLAVLVLLLFFALLLPSSSATDKQPDIEITTNSSNGTESESGSLEIIAGGVSAAVLVLVPAVVGIVFWMKRRGNPSTTKESSEENHMYGTYSRGWDGEGDYGDGDNVYVTDTNSEYYATS